MAEPTQKEDSNPFSMVGDLIGKVLGIPGTLAGDAGTALINSVRPDGKISILKLLNVGGIRDLEQKQRDLKTKSMELDNKIAEFNLGHAQRADVEHNVGLDTDTATAISQALGMQQGSPEQLQAGLAPELRAAQEAKRQAAAQQYAQFVGAPELASTMELAGSENLGRASIESAADAQAKREARAQAIELEGIRGARQIEVARQRAAFQAQTAREKAGIDLEKEWRKPQTVQNFFRQMLPPTTIHGVETRKGLGGREERIPVTYTKPRTQTDYQNAMTNALAAVDQFVAATNPVRPKKGKKKSLSIEENKARINMAKGIVGYQDKGLSFPAAQFFATMDTMPKEKVFEFEPKDLEGPNRNEESITQTMRFMAEGEKAGVAPDPKGFVQVMSIQLVKAGYSPQEAQAMIARAVAKARQSQ